MTTFLAAALVVLLTTVSLEVLFIIYLLNKNYNLSTEKKELELELKNMTQPKQYNNYQHHQQQQSNQRPNVYRVGEGS